MPRPATLLAALSQQELNEFLPEPMLGDLRTLPTRFELLDTTQITPAEFERVLAATDPEVLVTCWKTPSLPAVLPPRLRHVCHLAGSIKHLVSRGQIERGLIVSNWGGSISRIVAEGALLHILACLRRTTHWAVAMHRDRAWKDGGTETASLFGRRVGLHGFGPVARELVRLLQPFDCVISACAPDVTADTEARHSVRRVATLGDLFANNDIIVELAPLIPATTGSVTEKLLRLIPAGGVFVNVGRGAVVDEAGLLKVAREGRLLIGLDVFTTEPLPADSGFRGLPNVMLTPHLAGPTTDRRRDAGAFALDNLRAYAEDRPLQGTITPKVYDSST